MAGSGVGRGRGWLNLVRNSLDNSDVRPGGTPATPVQTSNMTNNVPETIQPNSAQYSKLITQISALDENDDGILLNQKLRFIIETWHDVCENEADVVESIKVIYQTGLSEEEFGSKVVNMVSSQSFKTQQIHNRGVRNEFIGLLQTYFESRKQIQVQNPSAFRGSVKMLSEFYNKARLCDGSPINFFATPLTQYLEMLLQAGQPEDLELFTVQLYLNGSAIRQILPTKLNELLIQVRQTLISNTHLTNNCKVWMLLALDIANHRFGLLPSDLHSFYQDQLGDKAMAHFQISPSHLSVQTLQTSKTLDGFQSNVNVLQVSTPEASTPNEQSVSPQNNNFPQFSNVSHANYNSAKGFSNSDSGMNIGKWKSSSDEPANRVEKPGRPILGAGARFNKTDCDKNNFSGWNSKQNNAWGGNKKSQNGQKNKKGWEHDDRFETDYN